jgi:DNA-binding transcriptional ArsR family regulator
MDADISTVAALIGDATRAQMLWALMGGVALPAGELAMSANVAPQTASAHLSKLLEANLISAEPQGRHRYYRLANPDIGAVIEALATVAPRSYASGRDGARDRNPLRFARTCYKHLAGTLAIQVNEALLHRAILLRDDSKRYRVTGEGQAWFEKLGVDVANIKSDPRGVARPCLDWTERRHHLAGPLGTALLQRLFEMKWLARIDKTRIVRATIKGQEHLHYLLGIEFTRS